jgi:hypothetical protein
MLLRYLALEQNNEKEKYVFYYVYDLFNEVTATEGGN